MHEQTRLLRRRVCIALAAALALPAAAWAQSGYPNKLIPAGGTSTEFAKFVTDDARAWGKVVRDNDIKAE